MGLLVNYPSQIGSNGWSLRSIFFGLSSQCLAIFFSSSKMVVILFHWISNVDMIKERDKDANPGLRRFII